MRRRKRRRRKRRLAWLHDSVREGGSAAVAVVARRGHSVGAASHILRTASVQRIVHDAIIVAQGPADTPLATILDLPKCPRDFATTLVMRWAELVTHTDISISSAAVSCSPVQHADQTKCFLDDTVERVIHGL
jgi:hypothetical protein